LSIVTNVTQLVNKMVVIRISQKTKEELNDFCLNRFRCNIDCISKDLIINELIKANKSLLERTKPLK
jgi:hypothetical protein